MANVDFPAPVGPVIALSGPPVSTISLPVPPIGVPVTLIGLPIASVRGQVPFSGNIPFLGGLVALASSPVARLGGMVSAIRCVVA